MRRIFIQANTKQLLGAKVAKYAMETRGEAASHDIPVTILHVEEMPEYMKYAGMTYRREDSLRTLDPNDLQFFTLSRFFPPSIMDYTGQALVIDPDIFALSSIVPLFREYDAPIAACGKKDAWDSSVMVLTNKNLTHWSPSNILGGLADHSKNYSDIITLRDEDVYELPRTYNNLDTLTDNTTLLHTTNRITQPWRTSLPIDFHRNTPPPILGIIPRIPILRMRGKWPSVYQPHPNPLIEETVLGLFREAFEHGVLQREEIDAAIRSSDIRPDIYTFLN